jgi:hypothetical protein
MPKPLRRPIAGVESKCGIGAQRRDETESPALGVWLAQTYYDFKDAEDAFAWRYTALGDLSSSLTCARTDGGRRAEAAVGSPRFSAARGPWRSS